MPSAQKRVPSLRTCQRSSPARPSRGRLHLRLGLAALDVLRREDDGRLPPDPLALLVTEEAADARVPAQDTPGSVGGEDGVVADALDNQAEEIFTRV